MEKQQLVNFIAKVMEESDFKVYKDFKTSQKTVDIYGVLKTVMGEFGVVVACKNYDKEWEVGIDVLKEMEMIGRNLRASKVAVVSSSSFSTQAKNYASKKNIKIIDRDNLMVLAKKFSKKRNHPSIDYPYDDSYMNSVNANDPNFNNFNNYDNFPDFNNQEPNYNFSNENYPYNQDNGYGDYDSGYAPYGSNSVYEDDATYISGRSSGGLGRYGANSNTSHYPVATNRGGLATYKKVKVNKTPLFERIKPILNNTIVLILLVVAISYLISTIIGIASGTSAGVVGLVKILSSLILSYGLVLFLDRDGTTVLVKGTTVFFVSLVILIIMIIAL